MALKKDKRINTTTKTVWRKVALPVEVKELIESNCLTSIQKNHLYHLIYLLSVDPTRNRFSIKEWQVLTCDYLETVIGKDYKKYRDFLVNMGIVECDNLFHKGKAYRYRLTYKQGGEITTIPFKYKSIMPLNQYRDDKTYTERFLEYFRTLEIPFLRLYREVDKIVHELSISDFPINRAVKMDGHRKVCIIDSERNTKELWLYKKQAIKKASDLGYVLIQDKTHFIIANPKEYIADKREFIKLSYTTAIDNLKSEDTLYARRNKTNNRLDTNFTTLASRLWKLIFDEKDYLELDQKNSQLAFFAFRLDKDCVQGEDVKLFKSLAYKGELYEFFMEKTGVDRDTAKLYVFEVLFSSNRCNTAGKKLFKSLFPTVWEYSVNFKRENGNNQFSIMLQKLESSIFIDRVYKPLTNYGIVCFTKHDSITVRKEDFDFTLQHIQEVYRQIGFKGTLKMPKVKTVAA